MSPADKKNTKIGQCHRIIQKRIVGQGSAHRRMTDEISFYFILFYLFLDFYFILLMAMRKREGIVCCRRLDKHERGETKKIHLYNNIKTHDGHRRYGRAGCDLHLLLRKKLKKLERNKYILKCCSWTPSEVTRRKSLASAYFWVPLMMGAG